MPNGGLESACTFVMFGLTHIICHSTQKLMYPVENGNKDQIAPRKKKSSGESFFCRHKLREKVVHEQPPIQTADRICLMSD